MAFQAPREIRQRRPSLLESGFDFGFESWGAARPGDLLGALPMGAQAILGAILAGRSSRPRTPVPPVVIGEIPRTISPGDSARGAISKEANIPEGFHSCQIAGEWRICQDEPEGGWSPIALPPIDEERWGDIIRTEVPVPVDDSEFDEHEDGTMAHTWFHSATELALGIWGPQQGGGAAPGPQSMASTEAWLQGATLGTDNGRPPCKRRRRRRALLTQSDLNVLNQIANLPNNTNVRTALAKAVR